MDHKADVSGTYWPPLIPVLGLASGESTKPEVIAQLLECRANPKAPHCGGFGMTHDLGAEHVGCQIPTLWQWQIFFCVRERTSTSKASLAACFVPVN